MAPVCLGKSGKESELWDNEDEDRRSHLGHGRVRLPRSPASYLGPCAARLRCLGVGWLQNWTNGSSRLAGWSIQKKKPISKILRMLKKPTKYVLLQMPKISSALLWIKNCPPGPLKP